MRLILKSLLAVLLAIASFLPAFAAETRTVAANRSSPIFFYYTYMGDTCGYGSKPKFTALSGPEHGTVTARWQAYKMGTGARNCKGKPMKGMLVIYTPDKGYHGPDVVRFSLTGSGGPGAGYSLSNNFKVNINVK